MSVSNLFVVNPDNLYAHSLTLSGALNVGNLVSDGLTVNGPTVLNGNVTYDTLASSNVVFGTNNVSFVNSTISGLPIEKLSDVIVISPVVNQALQWNGTNWGNGVVVLGNTWVPTLINSVNISSASVNSAFFIQNYNYVQASINFSYIPNNNANLAQLFASIPVPRSVSGNFTGISQCIGSGCEFISNTTNALYVNAVTSGQNILIFCPPVNNTGSVLCNIQFQYSI